MASEAVGINAATTNGTTVTAGGAAHTKGTWTELTPSLTIDGKGFWFQVFGSSAGNMYLVDIGTGGSGSETVVLGNFMIHMGAGGSVAAGRRIYVPLKIASGSRIVARCQHIATASATIAIGLRVVDADSALVRGCGRATTYGADTASTSGVSLDPGGSSHTKVRAEITASCTNGIEVLLVLQGFVGVAMSALRFLADLETGGAGSEVAFSHDLASASSNDGDTTWPGWFLVTDPGIAAGTRLVTNMQCSSTSTGRVQEFVWYGFDQQDAAPGGGGGSVIPVIGDAAGLVF